MPLDGQVSDYLAPDTETKPDLSKPSLEGLSWLLRHLPETHKWNFAIIGGETLCGSTGCAIGLAYAQWNNTIGSLRAFLGITPDVSVHFFSPSAYTAKAKDVTPTMVADRIDAYLASRNR
jgi:hypothetical protein